MLCQGEQWGEAWVPSGRETMQRMLDECLTPAAPKSTCQTSRAKWWKPTHVGGQEGTRSLLWVNLQLSCKRV